MTCTISLTIHNKANDFLNACRQWLEREEIVNNLILGLAGRAAGGCQPAAPAPVMITVANGAGLSAAAWMTPSRPVVLYAPGDEPGEALGQIAYALQSGGHSVAGCVGPKATAWAFAKAWTWQTGQSPLLRTAQRIYRLDKVVFPRGVAGQARRAQKTDLDLVAEWAYRFSREIGEPSDSQDCRIAAEQSIAAGKVLLWEDGGEPVSMASACRPTTNGICISRVYTPPQRRGHGYASACVARLSQDELDTGWRFCCLYTDLANPTSNSIYQKIGYVPVADSSHYDFRGHA